MYKKLHYYFFSVAFVGLFACSSDGDNGDVQQEIDTEKPVIVCPGDITINIAATDPDPIVSFETPIGTDNINAITSQIEGRASDSRFPEGTTTNTFRAADVAGNISTCSFNVIVIRDSPTADVPYFIGNNPAPSGKKWVKLNNVSDEFDDDSFDDTKWKTPTHRDGEVEHLVFLKQTLLLKLMAI